MTTPALIPVTAIYAIAAQVRETIHLVNDPATEYLYRISRSLQTRWRQIGSEDAHLMDALQKLTWITNLAVTTPLPIGFPGLDRFCSPDELLELLHYSGLTYPECSAMAQDTARAFEQAFPLAITELGVKVCELVEMHDRVALITGRQWLNSSVYEHIHSITGRPDIRLIRTSDLRKDEVYDVIIVTSPPSWIEPQVRNAIRAKQRDIVTLSLFQTDTGQVSVLPENWKPITTLRRSQRTATTAPSSHHEFGADFTAQDASEGFELASVLAHIQTQSTSTLPAGSYTTLGDAEAFQLANGSVVLLSADGRTWTIEQDGQDFHVEQRNTEDINSGDFIMLRTRRDRELIAEIADKTLGPRAPILRQMQTRWKRALLLKVKQRGLTGVARDLALLGLGSLATPMNVRRWTSDGFIRNHKYENWLIVMSYIGLETKAENLWNDMDEINDAHRQADFTISKVIKAELQYLSFKEIRDSMELPPMPELGDERLTLYLVHERLGKIRDVRFTDMNKAIHW